MVTQTGINWDQTQQRMQDAAGSIVIPGLILRIDEALFPSFIPGEDYDAERLAFAYGFGLSLKKYRETNNLFPDAFTKPFEESLNQIKTQLETTEQTDSIQKAADFGCNFGLMRIQNASKKYTDNDVMNSFLYTEMGILAASTTNLVKSHQLSYAKI